MALLSNALDKSAMVFYVDSMRLEGVELVHVIERIYTLSFSYHCSYQNIDNYASLKLI